MNRTLTIATTLTVLLVATACGSSDADDGSPTTQPPVVTTTDPDDVAPTTPPVEPPGSGTPPATDDPATDEPTTDEPAPSRPIATENITIDDGTYDSVGEMGEDASLIVVGEVAEVTSLGRPFLDRDPDANEFVAITLETVDTLAGEAVTEVVLPWEAFGADAEGNRTSTLITNGIRPADIGDRVVLFLQPADPQFAEFLGGFPTHQLVKLDGIAFLDGDRVVATEAGSTAAEQLLGMTVGDIRVALAG